MGISQLHTLTAQQIGLRTQGLSSVGPERSRYKPSDSDPSNSPAGGVGAKDSIQISSQGRAAAAAEAELADQKPDDQKPDRQTELSREEQKTVHEMKQRDREVRAHENAHKAAAGSLAKGGPTYSTQRGPDGKQYAVGGEVNIQLSKGSTPEQTLRNSRRAQQAASAPSDPSSQDRKVAAQATAMASEARREIASAKSDAGATETSAAGTSAAAEAAALRGPGVDFLV